MNRSKVIKRKLYRLFGNEAYKDGELNRPYLASKIFNNKSLLSKDECYCASKSSIAF